MLKLLNIWKKLTEDWCIIHIHYLERIYLYYCLTIHSNFLVHDILIFLSVFHDASESPFHEQRGHLFVGGLRCKFTQPPSQTTSEQFYPYFLYVSHYCFCDLLISISLLFWYFSSRVFSSEVSLMFRSTFTYILRFKTTGTLQLLTF